MLGSFQRISAMLLRYLYLHKRSVPRSFEIIFWPVMELFVWGFVTMYIQQTAGGDISRIIVFLINAMVFWDILYRSQQGVSISMVEEIWTQNILNLLISPLRIWEWITATFIYGFLKTTIITVMLGFLALALYRFNLIQADGLYLVPFAFNLLLFGWAVGIFTAGLVIRWGHAAEALIWGVPFLIQPLSAIFYPLSILPPWLQVISKCIPSTYVFEGMRTVIATGSLEAGNFWIAFSLNLVYFAAAGAFFYWMYHKARVAGRLGRLGMD
ncbi:MAG: ABC transporter permease [Candidatus Omnitrophica bacterium]|nr:ABC transporter permease [Candidatus Omnitrophota bacterium]